MKPILLILLFALFIFGTAWAQTCQPDTIVDLTPADRFTNNGDGTVTDDASGLMWKVCSEGQTYNAGSDDCDGSALTYTWQGALQQAEVVNLAVFAGQKDWRMPSLKELASIVDRQCFDPAANLEVFPGTPSVWFWSASPNVGSSTSAWGIYFERGSSAAATKSLYNHVRLVRGEQ